MCYDLFENHWIFQLHKLVYKFYFHLKEFFVDEVLPTLV
jgi:hypothetical protein